jgi:hypothetical protein
MYVSKCETQNIRKEYKKLFSVSINEIFAIDTKYNPKLLKALCTVLTISCMYMSVYSVCAAMQANS